MPEKHTRARKLSNANTKQEMLDAYNDLVKQFDEKRQAELKPEEKIEEKAVKQVVEVADALSTDGIVREIGALKSEIGKMLAQLSDKMEDEVKKYEGIKRAVVAKEAELQEIYEIQKSASSVAALLEAQHQKREEFELDMAAKKEELSREIQSLRVEWDKERKLHELEVRERDSAEHKRREREKEEYKYGFEREQQLAKERFEDEKSRLERDIQQKREQVEQELSEREQAVARREEELAELHRQVSVFPETLQTSIAEAVKDATEKVRLEAKNREELLKREFNGERNVLTTRIESLEQTVREQNEQLARFSQQLEKAYSQVQDIAVKTVEGSSGLKSFAGLQNFVAEQARKPQ